MRQTLKIILLVGAAAFTPQRLTTKHATTIGLPRPTRTYSFASIATNDQDLDEIISEPRQKNPSATNADNADLNEMEEFVSQMRELYGDLENGGGSVRRVMSAASFTYVAPGSTSPGENRQLNGAWRLQTPTLYDSSEDWPKMHCTILEERMEMESPDSSKPPPLLIYLPGLDGFGISATAQFDDLSSSFELWRMTGSRDNNQVSFSDLVNSVVKFVKDATSSTGSIESPREVVLVGESFGGLLTCAVSMALKKVQSKRKMFLKGMVLVNPATSFDQTNWEQLVPILTSLRYLESQEVTAGDTGKFPTPYSILGGMALSATIPDRSQYSNIYDFILQSTKSSSNESMLSASSDGFRILADYLPAKTLEHRVLEWIPVGTSVVNNPERLKKLDVPALIIGGSDDNMLPTKDETDRLGQLLPDCVKMDVTGAGHFVLDTRLNLTEIIIDSHIDPLNLNKKAYDPVMDWTLPPNDIVKAVIEKRVVPQREKTSPVFFSTDPITGKRRKGLSHVPSSKNKPLLFVGNHQLLGQDLGMIISELLEERGISARGLTHPMAIDGFSGGDTQESSKVRKQKQRWEFSEHGQAEVDLFSMFGAVKVSPRNFYRLLQTNQAVLLFPGGVKEALHGKGEEYQLFWPEKTDFIRLAAKFNATIVPLSAIGAADSAEIILSPREMLELPFGIGDNLKNFSSSAVSARVGDDEELFIPPLAVPKPFAARHYFLFGKAYDTTSLDPKDPDACRHIYKSIEEEVKHDIHALLEARKEDEYALDGIKRTSYQRLFGKDPPTFPLESLSPAKRQV